ncbi:MAG: N-acetyl-gamma-glutamyl-phosphate reductase [Rhodoblastus sp.]|nr:N-acetyl-gamma-glutamyl-phosphate reductase [Rhodoblastus sp.]MCC2101486.1 N-acetyl-gamma-glutamyl-phosphate reductase [Hyphomicrobiales bacterium]MCC2107810.1 N-acetyl-gamma-glutamyl-phosphate reductase [Hyphomicrobiales bacterium]MCO5088187.1 N-acetyl-gamma-glutamyl-phosphate reductase [Methylobacteriaceae bacterium]
MAARIFIDGEAGTTGLEIREKLGPHKGVELVSIDPERRKDSGAKTELLASVDLAILCLPDDAARETAAIVESLGSDGPRLLDASTAHRVADGWTYGFPELAAGQADAIMRARKVSNPGCYATGAIALLRPLVDAGLIAADMPLTINAVSGYSGGGRQMIEAYETHKAPLFEEYGLGLEHKHVPEIVKWSALTARPLFVPSVGNFRQGMLVNIPLHLDALPGKPKAAEIEATLSKHYAGQRYVRVVHPDNSGRLDALALNGTNDLELMVYANESRRQAVLVARLDNLGKGASGAAVQNCELMLGL